MVKFGGLWRMRTPMENFHRTSFTFKYFNFLFPFLRHLSKNARILIVIFLLTFPPPYWQLLSSQFSIFPTVWSVGDDWSPLGNPLNTMCAPLQKWLVQKTTFVLREITTEFVSLKLYKEIALIQLGKFLLRWVERGTSETLVIEVLAMGNIPKRNPLARKEKKRRKLKSLLSCTFFSEWSDFDLLLCKVRDINVL